MSECPFKSTCGNVYVKTETFLWLFLGRCTECSLDVFQSFFQLVLLINHRVVSNFPSRLLTCFHTITDSTCFLSPLTGHMSRDLVSAAVVRHNSLSHSAVAMTADRDISSSIISYKVDTCNQLKHKNE